MDAASGGGEDEEDELKDVGVDFQQTDGRATVRNLRLREDPAKYLLNLDKNSAHYDPKTRSMRENPLPAKDPSDLVYAGDNFVRSTGDVLKVQELQSFVWAANDRGNEDINLIANPSQAEKMFSSFQEKKEKLKDQKKRSVLEAYGGEEHLKTPARQLLLGETEAYVEYDESGRVVKGKEEAIPKSKYASLEDVYENNHTGVWGSFFDRKTGKWGYSCCQQTTRNAYCIGAKGKQLRREEEARAQRTSQGLPPASAATSMPPPALPAKRVASDAAAAVAGTVAGGAGTGAAGTAGSLGGLSYGGAASGGDGAGADASQLKRKRPASDGAPDGGKSKNKAKKKKKGSDSSSDSGSSSSSSGSGSSSSSSSSESDSDDDAQGGNAEDAKSALAKRKAMARAKRRDQSKVKRVKSSSATGASTASSAGSKSAGSKTGSGAIDTSVPTDAQMDEYRRTRMQDDDPMLKMVDTVDD